MPSQSWNCTGLVHWKLEPRKRQSQYQRGKMISTWLLPSCHPPVSEGLNAARGKKKGRKEEKERKVGKEGRDKEGRKKFIDKQWCQCYLGSREEPGNILQRPPSWDIDQGRGSTNSGTEGKQQWCLETGAKFLPPLAWHVRMCKHSKKSSNAVASSAFLNPLITKLFRSVLNGSSTHILHW